MSSFSFYYFKFPFFFLLTIISFHFISCAPSGGSRFTPGKKGTSPPAVRILLNEPSENLQIKLDDDITLFADNKETGKFRKGVMLDFIERDGLTFNSGRRGVKADAFTIKPSKNFTYAGKLLGGDIKLISDGKKIYLINTISIEEYLKGVIPSEMPLGTGNEYYEGLKAFAICARTFTLQRISSSDNIYDVRTDVRDQVYGGIGRGKDISNRVVDDTRGMILTYKNEPATVFYSSTCGGRTEDVENVFGSTGVPYLRSIVDGNPPFCSASPQAQWEEKLSGERIIALLQNSGKLNGGSYTLTDLKINSRFRSGKINELEIIVSGKNTGRKSVKLFGNSIRFILLSARNQTLNSNNFEITKSGNEFIFKGKGWGHGVGMCQWGTLIQSVKGISYIRILEHYFPGTKITGYYD
jgi:stage II sporulation protein D